PKQALGIVVQFAQTSGNSDSRDWTPPATVENPPPPVAVLGLRMRVSSVERAAVQWGEILQGQGVEKNGQLIYRWPRSPMILRVDVDPSAAEGPIAIEIATGRPLDLPGGPV